MKNKLTLKQKLKLALGGLTGMLQVANADPSPNRLTSNIPLPPTKVESYTESNLKGSGNSRIIVQNPHVYAGAGKTFPDDQEFGGAIVNIPLKNKKLTLAGNTVSSNAGRETEIKGNLSLGNTNLEAGILKTPNRNSSGFGRVAHNTDLRELNLEIGVRATEFQDETKPGFSGILSGKNWCTGFSHDGEQTRVNSGFSTDKYAADILHIDNTPGEPGPKITLANASLNPGVFYKEHPRKSRALGPRSAQSINPQTPLSQNFHRLFGIHEPGMGSKLNLRYKAVELPNGDKTSETSGVYFPELPEPLQGIYVGAEHIKSKKDSDTSGIVGLKRNIKGFKVNARYQHSRQDKKNLILSVARKF